MVSRAGWVVIADQDEVSRSDLVAALQLAGYETVEVADGIGALDAARAEHVGMLMLEVELPDMTGYEICHLLRENGDEVPIFLLSATRTERADRVAGLLLGADDFVIKPFDAGEVVARIHRHVSRRARSRPAATGNGTLAKFTSREQDVLRLLAKGLSQKEIARELSISSKTVGTHIQNLLGKTGVHSRAEVVARAYLMGLVEPVVADRRVAVSVSVDSTPRSGEGVEPSQRGAATPDRL
jgi:DNA-binding NarL/FixJ family response regulator